MSRKSIFFGLLMLSLMTFMESSVIQATTFDVDMGKQAPPCGGAGASDIGFVDCTNSTGGNFQTAYTLIDAGDTVRWTARSTPHTATSASAQAIAGACGTGDNFDSGTANAFTPGLVFTHTFNQAGSCAYFCIFHPIAMTGQVNVASAPTTTTTSSTTTTTTTSTTTTTTSTTTSTTTTTTSTTTSTTTTTTTTPTSTTTTTVKENCNDQNKGQGKDKGKGHPKGKCKGPGKDK